MFTLSQHTNEKVRKTQENATNVAALARERQYGKSEGTLSTQEPKGLDAAELVLAVELGSAKVMRNVSLFF